MGIIDELSGMKTKTEQRQIEENERLRQEKILRKQEEDKEKKKEIKKKQQEILNVLNSDDPELDIPYPYVEKRTNELTTGIKVSTRRVPIRGAFGYDYETIIENKGRVSGSAKIIEVGQKVITKREALMIELLGGNIYSPSIYVGIVEKNGEYGNQICTHPNVSDGFKISETDRVLLDREEAESYLESMPEEIKEKISEEIELKKRKIELIKSTRNKEMKKRGYLVYKGYVSSDVAVRTTFGRALLALGENRVKGFFVNEEKFIVKNITFDSIKKAIGNRLKGER